MFKRKRKQRQVKSVFSDQIILENSLASSECEIYLPEPKLKFGKVKGLSTLIRESGTILFGKSCVLHLCHVPIPYSPAEITLLLKDTEQENKVFLHMILNRHEHDLFYKIQEPHWHECQRKVNDCWRTIVIKFNKTNSEELVEFNKQLETVITELEADKSVPETYLLVAVPLKDQPPSNIDGILTKSSEHKETVTQPDILSNLDNQNRSSTVSSESSKTVDNEDLNDPSPLETTVTHNSSPAKSPPSCKGSSVPAPQPCTGLYDPVYDPSANLDEPPFDPAPFVPWTPAGEDINKTVSVTDTEDQSVEKTKIGPTEISDLCDSLHIHPKELPRRLASILNSIGSVGGQDNQGLDSEHLISEEIYMQMGVEKKMSAPSPQSAPSARLQEAMKIARSLQTAINEGDQQIAVMNAVKLAADNNVTVKIEVKEKEEKDPLFRLKVCIEDKDSSGGHISLMVRASDTIGDLKQRMSFKHQFPEEIQSWIIGKRIPPDTETLGQCMIKGADHTTYLYLRSAKSVGLTFEAYQKRRLEQFYPAAGDASPVIGENPVAGGTPMACNKLDGTYMAMHAVQKTPAVAAVGSQPAFREPGSATPPFKQTPAVVKQEAKVLAENLNTPTQKGPKPKQVVQGRVRDPSHIAEDHPLNLTGPDINAMLKQFSDFTVQNQEKSNPRVPVMHPEDEPTIGWVCSACTYINKPTRPGCEVCTQTRPLDYKVPDNYILSREEQDWLDQEAQLERQTKEADNPERDYEDYEQKRLDEMRKFHEALQDIVTKDNSAEHDTYRTYNIPPPRMDYGGLFVKARKDPVETSDDSP